MITIFAPDGIGEVNPGADLAELISDACAAAGRPLADGDLVCVTSKIISKAEDRAVPAERAAEAAAAESVAVVARRGGVRIVRNRQGITQAAAGIDSSNVEVGTILLLPQDPDASAAALLRELGARTGLRLGVIITDTAGRAWRIGQTDHAIGLAGVRPTLDHAGLRDSYGNDLRVTEMAVADELAAAADLAKGKLAGRPVAVIRGLAELITDAEHSARELQRPTEQDLFARGSREAVLWAVLSAYRSTKRYAELVELDGEELIKAVTDAVDGDPATVRAIVGTIA